MNATADTTRTERMERRQTILTTIGAVSCLGAICTSCAVQYPASASPVAWIASAALWLVTAACAVACFINTDRRKCKCLGYIRIDPDGGFRYE